MGVGSAAAAVYGLTRAIRRQDFSALWMLDPRAAPPPSVQRQLGLGGESDEDEPPRRRRRRDEFDEEREELEAKMQRAMHSNNVSRVQELSRRLDELEADRWERARNKEAGAYMRGGAMHLRCHGGACKRRSCLRHPPRRLPSHPRTRN